MRRVTSTHSDRRWHGRLFSLIAAAVAAVAVVATGSVHALAGGRPTVSPAADAAEIRLSGGVTAVRNQEALSQLRAWMFSQPGFGTSGYVGTIDDLANKRMTVMWYGPSTPLLKSIIAEGTRRGITVSVRHRKYSLQQLKTAAQSVFQQAAAGKWAGFRVSAVEALSATDNGLIIDGTYTSVPPTERAPQVRSLATEVNGVPARIVPGRPAEIASGRDDDFKPFNAGGFMKSNTTAGGSTKGEGCSSGFAVLRGGVSLVTTARHCIYQYPNTPNYKYFADYVSADWYNQAAPSDYHYGDTTGIYSSDGGAALLNSPGSSLSFIQAWNSTSSLRVVQLSDLGVNDLVCTDGGNSGEHCNVKVTNLLVEINDTDGNIAAIEAVQQTAGKIAVMAGDSGGPVIVNVASGEVGAAGMIQGYTGTGMTGSGCGPSYDTNSCSTNVLFTSMRTIINSIPGGASLLTG